VGLQPEYYPAIQKAKVVGIGDAHSSIRGTLNKEIKGSAFVVDRWHRNETCKGHGSDCASAYNDMHHLSTTGAIKEAMDKLESAGPRGAKIATILSTCGQSDLPANTFLFPGAIDGWDNGGFSSSSPAEGWFGKNKPGRQHPIIFSLYRFIYQDLLSYLERAALARILFARSFDGEEKGKEGESDEMKTWRRRLTPAAVEDLAMELRMHDEKRVETTWVGGCVFQVATSYETRGGDVGEAGAGVRGKRRRPSAKGTVSRRFVKGQNVEVWWAAKGRKGNWYEATVLKAQTSEVKVHYVDGKDSEREWIKKNDTKRLRCVSEEGRGDTEDADLPPGKVLIGVTPRFPSALNLIIE